MVDPCPAGGIGYYVHHHGIGHWQRAVLLARHLRRPVTLLGTLPDDRAAGAPCPVLALPDDAPAPTTAPTTPPGAPADPGVAGGLHYAPTGHDGLRRRAAMLAGWIAQHRPALMVVDVSVEAALLSRLCATPLLYVRLAGARDDPPHLLAFRSAEALLAPFPAELDEGGVPDWAMRKTFHAGFLSPPPDTAAAPEPDLVAVVFGRGGAGGDRTSLIRAARAVPERRWRVLGPVSGGDEALPGNLELLGWHPRPAAVLAGAGVVVGGGGDGLVSEVAALGRRFLCLPEARPFDEQGRKARRLAALGAAVVREGWPEASEWPALLRAADRLDPARIAALHDPGAVARAAGFIDALADDVARRDAG